jgi:hypothetical protein
MSDHGGVVAMNPRSGRTKHDHLRKVSEMDRREVGSDRGLGHSGSKFNSAGT